MTRYAGDDRIRTIVRHRSGTEVARKMSSPGKVVELFAGVGGFRLGLEGGRPTFDQDTGWSYPREHPDWEVVWANQWEPSTVSQPAFDCYVERFTDGVHVNRDIAAVLNELDVPKYDGSTVRRRLAELADGLPEEFDLLVGGFPCQDYSVAKPLRQAGGLGGEKGALWWEIARILQQYRPAHVLLENVDRLLVSPGSQRGRDFAVMLSCFAQLGYAVEWRVVNAAEYGFPQRRRRVFIYATTENAWFSQLGVAGPYNVGSNDWTALLDDHGDEAMTKLGVLASALPCRLDDDEPRTVPLTDGGTVDPHEVSESWPRPDVGRWQNAGVMVGGIVRTAKVESTYDGPHLALEDVLLPIDEIVRSHPEFVIPPGQRDPGENPRKGTWDYLKGPKHEERTKRVGARTISYTYSEGRVRFPEPLKEAARTILTGEGGTSPSRFKLVVAQELPDELVDDESLPPHVRDAVTYNDKTGKPELYRRLVPKELERLDGFEDDWTADTPRMTAGKRAFCLGNALVVGVVQAIGDEIARRRSLQGSR